MNLRLIEYQARHCAVQFKITRQPVLLTNLCHCKVKLTIVKEISKMNTMCNLLYMNKISKISSFSRAMRRQLIKSNGDHLSRRFKRNLNYNGPEPEVDMRLKKSTTAVVSMPRGKKTQSTQHQEEINKWWCFSWDRKCIIWLWDIGLGLYVAWKLLLLYTWFAIHMTLSRNISIDGEN